MKKRKEKIYLIRCSSNPKIGLGHFMRCLKIYNELKKKKEKAIMFIDKKIDFMNNFNFKFYEIYPRNKSFKDEKKDAEKFIALVRKKYRNYNFIIIKDDYRLKYNWEKTVKNKINSRMVTLTDFENLSHYSDTIINPKTKFYNVTRPIVKKISNKKTTYLLGPRYSMINKIVKNKRNKIFTVIINFGATKNVNLINNIINEIILKCRSIKFIFVLGPYYKIDFFKKKFGKKIHRIKFVTNQYNLQKIYSNSHLFVGAAGNSVYETTAQKLPGIFFEISKNQSTSFNSLEKMGQYFLLSKINLKKNKLFKIKELINNIKDNYNVISQELKRSLIQIDDKGVSRIANFLTTKNQIKIKKEILINKKFKKSEYKIIKCKFLDINTYLEARNRKENIRQSFRNSSIDKIDHYLWWFKNNISSFKLNRGNETMLYFYHFPIKILKHFYYISGWFNSSNNSTIQDIIYGLNWQRKYINLKTKKISSWISFVKKDNILAQKYSAKLGWTKIQHKNKLYNSLKRQYKFGNTYVYTRK